MADKLVVYATVVEAGNFTRAGERLFLSQSAVSRIVEALEREYGVHLLDRTNKAVRPTLAGHIVYQHALNSIALADDTRRKIRELRDEPAGLLAIGAGYSYGEYILPHVMAEFLRQYPMVQPKITIMNSRRIAQRVKDGALHVGIVEGEVGVEGLESRPFGQDELLVVVPIGHPLAGRDTIALRDLAEEQWILREPGSAIRQMVDRVFLDHGLAPNLLMEFGSSQIIKESVIAGLGISLMSKWSIRAEVTQGHLKPLRLTDYPILNPFCTVIKPSGFHSKVVTVFQKFLSSYSADSLEIGRW